ncbi:MAG: DUF72 domain-containing protein [Acidobacteria bacterium]|nr:DUF72 domain-containing protein [Acidobacteriota bacterium]
MIRVGPAGWSYEDWNGIVYPKPAPRGFDPLAYLAGYFDTIEINSSFYRPPQAKSAAAWAGRVAAHPDFRFTAKLFRSFTHEVSSVRPDDERAFREGIRPLTEAGLLGAVLIQFPWSFKNEPASRSYLFGLLDRFSDLPRVVEVRHRSWNSADILEELRTRGAGTCNIDQPVFARSLAPGEVVTSAVGYVRLHGRNYQDWFTDTPGGVERYNYLYTPVELEPWIERIRSIASDTREVYVITNNHFEGKAVVNALEIRSSLSGVPVRVPESLPKQYPRLSKIELGGEPGRLPLLDATE